MQMTLPSVFCLWGLLQLFIFCNFTTSFDNSAYFDDHPVVYTYDRLSEIEKECSPYLSSASELKPDDSRSYRLKMELSFFNGDWVQENGGAPLLPFDDSDIPRYISSRSSPLRLVGFEVKDVNPIHLLENAVSLHGTMCIGIARNSSLLYDAYSIFHTSPGMSVLRISYEGVYFETMQNGGERLLCMLGNTTLPYGRWIDDGGSSDMSGSFGTLSNLQHKRLRDDSLLLVLRYPQHFSLTKRAILGELRSLNEKGNARYFDVVHIFSQLSRYSKYEFSSEKLKSRACDSSLYQDELVEDGANSFNSSEFCKALRHFSQEIFAIVPNWRFIGRYDYTRRLGPFLLGQEIDTEYSSHENFRLIIQNLICEQETARVAAVLRAVPAEMDRSTATMRTAISSMTLSVEGTWMASKGQLCMVGCLGIVGAGLEGCDSQISLYFPSSLSIKQRSPIMGSISSNKDGSNSYIPIIFELGIRPTDLYYNHMLYSRSYLLYNYSKIELVGASRKRSQIADLITSAKHFVLTYPALRDDKDLLARLDVLSRDLSIFAYGIPASLGHSGNPETFIQLEVLSLGPLLGGYAPWLHRNRPRESPVEISKSQHLNVSLSLMFTEGPVIFTERDYKNISKLFLEGLYDPLTGEMKLVGCRKIRVKTERFKSERGLDCLIEVKIGYPANILRWLINPTAKVTITSQRNEDDALYFCPIKLQTYMLSYGRYEQDGVFRKVFEEILRNLMIAVSIALILSQLIYIKENADAIPYVSRVMLALQCFGYLLPLIHDTRVLFPEKEYKGPYNLYGYEQMLNILAFTGKILSLAAFLLTATVTRKVALFCKNLHSSLPSKSREVPTEKQVFLVTALIHALGFLSYYHLYGNLFQNVITSTIEDDQKKKLWMYKEEEYIGFTQDLFLLPQIIGNILWKTDVRSLQKIYYIGFTLIRLLLHIYDFVRDPVVNPYSDEAAFLDLNSFFTPRAYNIVVAVIMSVLAVVVYIQQKEHHQNHPKTMVSKFPSSKYA